MHYAGSRSQRYGTTTYAQHGDDLMICNLFTLLGIEKPNYLDLGAHHPERLSNTALLYSRGSRGVNVEANPIMFQHFQTMRPEDKNLNLGVGAESGVRPFYMYDESSGRNSFSKEDITGCGLEIRKTIEVEVIDVNALVDKYCGGIWPAFLNTDIEGWDYSVLEAANFTDTWPQIICAEVHSGVGDKMKRMLSAKGYFCYCRMGENLIFARTYYMEKLY